MNNYLEIQAKLSTKNFEKQIEKLESDLEKLNYEYNAIKKGGDFDGKTQELKKYRSEAERVRNKLIELRKKQEEVNKKNLDNLSKSMSKINNSTESVIKKVARWGLAIFGIRSAYMFIRQSMSSLSQYNEKIGADLQYIRFALASSLQPLIEKIIQLVYKLLAYIGYIAKAWFGVNIFANASVQTFQKVNKGVKDTNKSAKQLQKTLAGFDEMNILQKTGDTTTGGGGGGVSLPSQDLSDLANIEIPDWVDWIAQHGELIKNIIIGIGEAFLTWKLISWATELGAFTTGLSAFAKVLQTGGIILMIVGIVGAIGDFINLIADPSWSNFFVLIQDLSVALAGLGALLIGINASNPFGWVTLAVGVIGLLIGSLGNLISKQEEEKNSTLSVKDANENLKKAQEDLNKATNNYSSALKNTKKAKEELIKAEQKAKQTGKELYNQVLLGIVSFDDMTDTQKDLYAKYLDNKEAEDKLREKTIELQQANDKATASEQKKASAVYASTGKYTDYFNALIKGYENGEVSSRKMENVVRNIMLNLDDNTRKTFAENLPQSIKDGFQKALDEMGRTDLKLHDVSTGITLSYKEIASSTKKTFETDVPNSIQKSINKVDSLTKSIDNLKKKGNVSVGVTTSYSGGGSRNAKGAIYYPPKLAVGGIINQPGRGVPLAMGGERGAEGVIPLTDSQQMQRIGEAIGKYITINATLINEMNGNVLSRELKRIESDKEFATNGG